MFEDIIEKTTIGTLGFIGSWTLATVNAILSALVAILTIVYLVISIKKKLKE